MLRIKNLAPFLTLALLAYLAVWSSGVARATALAREGASAATPGNREGSTKVPVIVELFTSEGCSDCPPADRLLYQLEQTQPVPGAEIITLEQHVDYWNSGGWRDPFSSAQFTERQTDYVQAMHRETAYTPQIIVDGNASLVGSDQRGVLAAIAKAAQVPKGTVEFEQRENPNAKPRSDSFVELTSPADWDPKDGAKVLLAVTEDNLSSNVLRGENAGAHFIHRAVVRQLRVIGKTDSSGAFSGEPEINLASDWNPQNIRITVFAQDRSKGRILGAASIRLANAVK